MTNVQKAVDALGEEFDTVHIFVTKHEGSINATFAGGRHCGSCYTRYGQIREWLITVDEQTRRDAPIGDKTTGEPPV